MDAKSLNRRVLVLLVILIVIGGVFVGRNYRLGGEYFSWMKTLILELSFFKAMVSPELSFDKELEVGLSEIDFERLLSGKGVPAEEEEVNVEKGEEPIGESQEAKIGLVAKLTLGEIQERINEIEEKTEEIGREVEKLSILNEIQEKVDDIAEKTELVKQEINRLNALAGMQEGVDSVAAASDILGQEIFSPA